MSSTSLPSSSSVRLIATEPSSPALSPSSHTMTLGYLLSSVEACTAFMLVLTTLADVCILATAHDDSKSSVKIRSSFSSGSVHTFTHIGTAEP